MVVLQNGIVTLHWVKEKEHPTVEVWQALLDVGDDLGENDAKVSLSNYM